MKVRKLTIEQKEQLVDKTYDYVQYFNPVLDADNNWFISNEEIYNCLEKSRIEWIDNLPEIDYNPIINYGLNN
jgi:hypothetical protein